MSKLCLQQSPLFVNIGFIYSKINVNITSSSTESNWPRDGVLARFFLPQESGFRTFFVPGGGENLPVQNIRQGLQGVMVRLGID